MAARAAVLLLGLLGPVAARAAARDAGAFSPIGTVVSLLSDMKATVEKDAQEDLEAYDKYMCWCETNEKAKTAAIAAAEQTIQDLNAFLQEAAGKEGQLKTEIAQLAESIAADQDALSSAAAVRAKEEAAFRALEADSKETRALLGQALDTLQKVQLVQKGGKARPADRQAAAHALIQVRNVVGRYPKFHSVMQRDLFDVLGSLEVVERHQVLEQKTQAALLSEAFLPKRGAAALDQTGLLPWEKTEEQIGAEARPNEQQGAAAGAKSYNSRSGAIVGILAEMLDEFTRDLSAAQRADLDAEVQFQHLRAAKTDEIAAATEQKKQKEVALADLLAQVAQAKKDLEATTEALGADQTFLLNLKANCKSEDEQYQTRVKDRSEELRALAETLKILTEDDARDLFHKTASFFQLSSSRQGEASAEWLARQDIAAEKAMQRLAAVARRHKNWSLASLAVRVRLDAFEKVKEAMDKMLAELAKQQKEEYDKNEFCKKEIDETEDSIKVSERTKKDLAEKHQALSNTLDTLAREIEELKTEVHDMEVALKQAGEQRKAGNQLFQNTLADQRATVNIIKKAQKRLQDFYALVEVKEHRRAAQQQTPGAAMAPPPPTPNDFEKSGSAGGVLQLLAMIVNNAERAEVDLQAGEQQAQEVYAEFVRDTADSIEKDRALIQEKEALVAGTSGDKSETQAAQLANDQELEKLNGILKAQHLDCDFLVQYFTTRQKARQEEMDSINDAKAILSGTNFGK